MNRLITIVSALSLKQILTVFQILALLGGGSWALFEYFAIDAKLKASELAVSNLQARLNSASIDEKSRDIALKDLDLKVGEQKRTLDLNKQEVDLQLAGISVSEKKSDSALKSIALEKAQSKPTTVERHFTVRAVQEIPDTALTEYSVALTGSVENRSEAKMEVSAVVVDLLEGEIPSGTAPAPRKLDRIGDPPTVFFTSLEPGDVRWTRIDRRATVIVEGREIVEQNRYLAAK